VSGTRDRPRTTRAAASQAPATPGSAGGAGLLRASVRMELLKLVCQPAIQVLAAVVVAGPVAFAGVLSSQSTSPSDALLGNWAHTSGYSLSLVLLSFAGNWGAPIIAGVLAGDLFASEDRHRTWKTLLGRSASLGQIFAGKLIAVLVLGLGLGVSLGMASIVGGIIFVGAHPMVNLSGELLSSSHVLLLTGLAWLLTLLPLLAFVAIAALVSIATRNAIIGVLAPLLVGLVDQLLALTGNGVWLHLLLIGSGFTAWEGIFTRHVFLGPALVSELACLVWISGAVYGSWRLLSRREFVPAAAATGRPGRARRALVPLRIAAVGVLVVGLLVLATTLGPTGVNDRRVTASLATTFQSLTIYQQDLLGHPIPAGSKYSIMPLCNKRGSKPVGQGDWDCTVDVYVLLPGGAQPLTDTPVDYDVSVDSDGCYKADAPAIIVGGATIKRKPGGGVTVNPLNILYGCFNVL
jgi:ABC-2 type transport system permease protein